MKSRILGFAAAAVAWAGLLTPGGAIAEELFLRLQAPLDEPKGFCLDIPGHRPTSAATVIEADHA